MPARPKSICRKVACGALIDSPGFCEKHKEHATGWNRSNEGKTAAQRGYGWSWQLKRDRVLRRDCGICQIRGPNCCVIARDVDHIVNKKEAERRGWTKEQIDDETNLQSACTVCHKEKTAAERR
jgi:5-methylcytosine-specific restriction protein A